MAAEEVDMGMHGESRMDGGTRMRLGLSAALLVASGCLRLAAPHLSLAALSSWRAATRAVASAQAALASVAPFALWDVLALALVAFALVRLVAHLRARDGLLPWASWVALALSYALAAFVCWALNHYGPPLTSQLGLDVADAYSVDELAEATTHYLTRAAELAPQVAREEDNTLAEQDFLGLARKAGAAYAPLAQRWRAFGGTTAPVKALLVWGPPLLASGHTGIYWAPTGEAGVPLDVARADLGFIMCHEAAHRLGIASEQEANLAAYLACEASDDVRLAYSGAFNAFCYCLNALWAADAERAQQVVSEVAGAGLAEGVSLVLADHAAAHAHYQAYEGPFRTVGTAVNDGYLRSFGEAAGVRSYGLVVDALIAWYQAGA